ncbi:hypothetical protein V8C86DRAFT_2561061 [Haematococcus lacustris]
MLVVYQEPLYAFVPMLAMSITAYQLVSLASPALGRAQPAGLPASGVQPASLPGPWAFGLFSTELGEFHCLVLLIALAVQRLYNWLLSAPQELAHLPVPQPLPLRKPTSQPPASAPTSSTHAQQAVLNQVFSDCIAAARMQPDTMDGNKKTGTNKKFGLFFTAVPKTNVPDYNNFVKPGNEMWLDKIKGKNRSNKYPSRQAFMADIVAIHTNAVAYNSPFNGKAAYFPAIGLAKELVDTCAAFLESRAAELQAAESAIQAARQTAAEPAAAQPVPTVQEDKQGWVECSLCEKWRQVPLSVADEVAASDADWYCSMRPGTTCDTPPDEGG